MLTSSKTITCSRLPLLLCKNQVQATPGLSVTQSVGRQQFAQDVLGALDYERDVAGVGDHVQLVIRQLGRHVFGSLRKQQFLVPDV
jgi:hypothetical protein